MPVTYQSDHLEVMLARLPEEFKTVPELVAVLTLLARQVQDLEDAFRDLLTKRGLAGQGAQLDAVGRLLDETRDGEADDVYRARLAAKVREMRGSGTYQDVLDIMRLLSGNVVGYTHAGGASFLLDVGRIAAADVVTAASRFLARSKDAGVLGEGLYTVDTLALTFTLGDASGGSVPGLGLGDASDPTVGGSLAGVL